MLDSEAAQPGIDLQRIRDIATADNLATAISDSDQSSLGQKVIDGLEIDEASMSDWTQRMETALQLAMLDKEDKRYPWDGAANIRYPLITSAALQYNARAYPAIVPSTDLVKVSVKGRDVDGSKAARAARVAEFMTWQLAMASREWERGTDQLTMQLPIVGDVFRKLWWDAATDRIRTQIRLPGKHVVVNNNATTLQSAPRISDKIELYPYQVQTHFRTGRFKEITLTEGSSDDQEPICFVEQMCRADLDGDGYEEPYIVTVHRETAQVVRVVAGYSMSTVRLAGNKIIAADPDQYMIHYQFMPSMDGGLFGTGLGLLLGDISETVNSTMNMIMDSGHMSSLGGGFIGAQNFRVKGGVQRIKPGEFKQVNFTGNDIRAGIVPMQFPGPSPVMFQMLGMLIDAGREITSVSNVMTGDVARQNMPVGTVMALIEQGQMVFTASYKRIYRALQDEFELICRLNRQHLTPEAYNKFLDGEQPADPRFDFDMSDMDIVPVADPKSVTSMQQMARVQFLFDLAKQGVLDMGATMQRVLAAASIENPEELMPKPDPRAAVMDAVQQELVMIELKMKDAELDEKIATTMQKLAAASKDAAQVDLVPIQARIAELQAMKGILDAQRARLDGGSAGGVAGAPGDAMAAGGVAQGQQVQPGPADFGAMGAGPM